MELLAVDAPLTQVGNGIRVGLRLWDGNAISLDAVRLNRLLQLKCLPCPGTPEALDAPLETHSDAVATVLRCSTEPGTGVGKALQSSNLRPVTDRREGPPAD